MSQHDLERRVGEVCARAVKTWGSKVQMGMVQEECAELIAAINRFARGRIGVDELASEVADVIITIGQARLMVGSAVVDEHVLRKLERLEARLDEAARSA